MMPNIDINIYCADPAEGWSFTIRHRGGIVARGDGSPTLGECIREVITEINALADLLALLSGLHGGALDDGVASGMTAQLPLDHGAVVTFGGMTFCPTGKFVFGPRAKVERAIVERGGAVSGQPTRATDYLVVGSLASRDWAATSYGRKIEAALAMRAAGGGIVIVGEDALVAAL